MGRDEDTRDWMDRRGQPSDGDRGYVIQLTIPARLLRLAIDAGRDTPGGES